MELRTPGLVENIVVSFLFSLPLLIAITVIVILIKTMRSKSPRPRIRKIAGFILTAIISSIIVLATLYLPKTINSPDQLNNILCGWPLPFLQFDSVMNPPEPWTMSCIGWTGSPMDTKKEILWIPFLINVAIIFVGIWAGAYLLRLLSKGKR